MFSGLEKELAKEACKEIIIPYAKQLLEKLIKEGKVNVVITLSYYPYENANIEDFLETIEKTINVHSKDKIGDGVYRKEDMLIIAKVSLVCESLPLDLIEEINDDLIDLEEAASTVYGLKLFVYANLKKLWEGFNILLQVYKELDKRFKTEDHAVILTFYEGDKMLKWLKKLIGNRGIIEMVDAKKINVMLKVYDSDIVRDIHGHMTKPWRKIIPCIC